MGKSDKSTFFRKDPYYIPGYAGHCPQYRFVVGSTYAQLTQDLLTNRTPVPQHTLLATVLPTEQEGHPTQEANRVMNIKPRLAVGHHIYRRDMTSGYAGLVPHSANKFGCSFPCQSLLALADFESQQRHVHQYNASTDLMLDVQDGLIHAYDVPRCVEIPPKTLRHGAPLTRVQANHDPYRREDNHMAGMSVYDLPNDNPNKYVTAGYLGHIPKVHTLCGATNKPLTHKALQLFGDGRPFFKPAPPNDCFVTEYDAQVMPERRSPVPLPEPTDKEPEKIVEYKKFPVEIGLTPNYAGHQPGYVDMVGLTFGNGTKKLVEIGCPNPLRPRIEDDSRPILDCCLPARLDFPYLTDKHEKRIL